MIVWNPGQNDSVPRANLVEQTLVEYPIPLLQMRNNDGTVMTATGGAGLFSIFATGAILLIGETANSNTKTDYALTEFVIPPEYVAAHDFKVIVNAEWTDMGNLTTRTVDVEAYLVGDDGADGADICATAAEVVDQTATDYPFTVTAATLTPSAKLKIRVTAVATEADSCDAHMVVHNIRVQADIKG